MYLLNQSTKYRITATNGSTNTLSVPTNLPDEKLPEKNIQFA